MLAPPRKRPRSPSPPLDEVPSPLDILLKRRRQTRESSEDIGSYSPGGPAAYAYAASPETPVHGPTAHGHRAESSSAPWTRFVEKRRTRQWEKLNAPHLSMSAGAGSGGYSGHGYGLSQPDFGEPSSSPLRPQWHSQPHPSRAPMSSSPVRHHPPSSSPFRPAGLSQSHGPPEDMEELMDEEDMRREWGEEYAEQNSLLHSLHLSRRPSHTYTSTPDLTILQTPGILSPMSAHPPTPYRNHHIPSSSPFASHTTRVSEASGGVFSTPGGAGDDSMELEYISETGEAEEEVKSRYEETNRLLAELEVVRRARLEGMSMAETSH